jgi:hypothetical protein
MTSIHIHNVTVSSLETPLRLRKVRLRRDVGGATTLNVVPSCASADLYDDSTYLKESIKSDCRHASSVLLQPS